MIVTSDATAKAAACRAEAKTVSVDATGAWEMEAVEAEMRVALYAERAEKAVRRLT